MSGSSVAASTIAWIQGRVCVRLYSRAGATRPPQYRAGGGRARAETTGSQACDGGRVERRRAERPEDLVGRQCIVGDQQSDAGREALADDVPVVEKLDL